MTFWPDFAAVDDALAGAVELALAEDLPIAAASIYFGPADDPRAPRPACRIYRGAMPAVGYGEARRGVPQQQVWRLTIDQVAEGDYDVDVLDESWSYPAGPGDDLAAIQAGILAALGASAVSTASDDGDDVLVTAVDAGVHLAVKVSPNLSAAVERDRKHLETAAAGELTVTFQLVSVLSATSPSGSQHALAYATLLRSRLWHPDVLAVFRSAGLGLLRVAGGPTAGLDETLDTVTETRANLDVVFSVRLGATSRPPLIESATPVEGTLT